MHEFGIAQSILTAVDTEAARYPGARLVKVGVCIGPMAGMPGDCSGGIQSDHVRASGGFGMKSESIAVNCARLCGLTHHPMKTNHGATYRPLLLAAIARLHGECAQCQREAIVTYGAPLETVNA